nr:unnamed protein product [Callosobruchus analis]
MSVKFVYSKPQIKDNLRFTPLRHPDSFSSFKPSICPHCDAEFKSKKGLGNHILNSHPKFVASITSKIHECKTCMFKTTLKCDLTTHMMEHSDKSCLNIFPNNFTSSRIMTEFVKVETFDIYDLNTEVPLEKIKSEVFLDDDKFGFNGAQLHKNVDIIGEEGAHLKSTHDVKINGFAVTADYRCYSFFSIPQEKILGHEVHILHSTAETGIRGCYRCNYTTDDKALLIDHMKVHTIEKNARMREESTNKNVTIHLNSITSTSSTYECTSDRLLPKSSSCATRRYYKCGGCDEEFDIKLRLDQHTLRKHPQLISSITTKMHECKICNFKSVRKTAFDRHMLQHSVEETSYKFHSCIHCNARFRNKISLDDHIKKTSEIYRISNKQDT